MDKLLKKMEGITDRKARFRTSVTLILNGEVYQFDGIVNGHLTEVKTGNGGFGYDPLFVPDGYNRTFAQMSLEEKNPISHRGRAIHDLIGFLNTIS
jgi:XTP/dITP diphosphohydrolase